jgi:hypothetical protein
MEVLQKAFRRFGAAALAAAFVVAPVGVAQASDRFVGDLVYCDQNANGIYDDDELPLDGVDVSVVCSNDSGQVCAVEMATTGEFDDSLDRLDPVANVYNEVCAALDPSIPDPFDPAQSSGRYLVEIGRRCPLLQFGPFTCEVSVDESTLPSECNVRVTPNPGFPADDGDGRFCVSGPFPEGQPLGDQGNCLAYPDPAPTGGAYHARFETFQDGDVCSLHNDFGYTPGARDFTTRTIGYWKTHPDAIAQFLPLEFCGETIDDVCDAVELLSLRGGGLENFTRQAVAAELNCSAFDCPADVMDLISEGSAACEAGGEFPFGAGGTVLDTYNNSGDELEDDLDAGPADPHFCQ